MSLIPNDNVIADLGAYTKLDGTTATLGETAQLGDVDLRENTFYSSFSDAITLTPEAQALPNMKGSGQVRDLREAVSLLYFLSLKGKENGRIVGRPKAKINENRTA